VKAVVTSLVLPVQPMPQPTMPSTWLTHKAVVLSLTIWNSGAVAPRAAKPVPGGT
jgi:hypothetical protein